MTADNVALLVIDMVKDNFDATQKSPITPLGLGIIRPINRLSRKLRSAGGKIVYSTDAFHESDFIFTGKLVPHSLAGSEGAEVIDALEREPEDLWLPKPRFSAFFDTDLATWLKQRQITLCAVAGMATHICVLTTIMDALCHDFKAWLLEDCATAYPEKNHHNMVDSFRRNPLYPLLRVGRSDELLAELGVD